MPFDVFDKDLSASDLADKSFSELIEQAAQELLTPAEIQDVSERAVAHVLRRISERSVVDS